MATAPAASVTPSATVPITRRLRMYVKPEASAHVCVALEGVVTIGTAEQVIALPDEYLTDAELQAHADTEGRTTWDEDDICALMQCVRGPQPQRPDPAAPDVADAPVSA